MESVKKVASYIAQRYKKEFGERISEMKLHKLLYFTQRESLIQLGEPLFNFSCMEIRSRYSFYQASVRFG